MKQLQCVISILLIALVPMFFIAGYIVLVVMILLSFNANAFAKERPIIVAVIDTGIDLNIMKQGRKKGICRFGHKSFAPKLKKKTKKEKYEWAQLKDINGHGTNISGLIHKYAGKSNYCQVILKFYKKDSYNNLTAIIRSLKRAIELNVDIINISGGGLERSDYEKRLIKKALDMGIFVITAAGNEMSDSSAKGYYPANYYNDVIVVGSRYGDKHTRRRSRRLASSNFGKKIDIYEVGFEQKGSYGKEMTGTSQATAITTGKFVKYLNHRRKYVQNR